MSLRYFEDLKVGDMLYGSEEFVVTKEEVVEYAKRWDPQPFHTDETAARDSMFGGLVAPASFVLAIESWLWHTIEDRPALAVGVGYDDLRLLNPVRPGDRLSITIEIVEARPSESRPDCGIVRTRVILTNQRDEQVLTLIDTCLISKRGA